MSKFLKLKSRHGGHTLVAASQIAAVFEDQEGCTISLATGEEISVKEDYQTLVNRLTKGDADSE